MATNVLAAGAWRVSQRLGERLDRWRRWSGEGRARVQAVPIGAAQLLLLAALWITAHPYVGIEHDARYYMLQAIRANDPGRFADDLYFKYGSQDNFTLFTAAYAPVVARLGPGMAHLLFFVGEQALWFAALIWLSRLLFDRKTWLAATVAMILCDGHYGSRHIFEYGEMFVTSRPPAEAFVLCALACLARRRIVLGLAFTVLAGLAHPLMALAGVGVFAVLALLHWRVWARRLWPLALAVGAAGVACLVLRVGPFARVFATFDSHWFDIVEQRSSYTFLAHWSLADWLQLATTLGVLGFASFGAHPHRPLFRAAALTAILALVADVVLGDVGRGVLAVDAQLWRVMWLATLFANGFAGYLIATEPPGSVSRPIILVALALSAMTRFVFLEIDIV